MLHRGRDRNLRDRNFAPAGVIVKQGRLFEFGVEQAMPGTIFIDAEGNIVDRVSGKLKRTDLAQRLRKLTGEPEPVQTATKKTAKKKSAEK
jgi:hypothetical protein